MLRAAEGVFHHIPSFALQTEPGALSSAILSLISMSCKSIDQPCCWSWWSLERQEGRGHRSCRSTSHGGTSPCPLCPWAAPSLCFAPNSTARICPGRILDLSWVGCSCTVVPAAGQSLSPSGGVSIPNLGSQAPVGVGSRAGFIPHAELVADS